ncbi:MAG: PEP-CTERM sorting domain-containing protein [Leptolyngbya sp. SIO3F4]|nr:PEP-CTERM sorting domain-containing protein [Leptolyngbya sp. SIO3F4]
MVGYDTAVAESCLSTTCLLDGSISYGVSLVLSEFITITNDLLSNSNITLSQEATTAIASLQQTAQLAQLFGPTLNLATVAVDNFEVTTDPISADPNGSKLDATVTGGLITATTITGTQEEEIFSQSFASEVTSQTSVTSGTKTSQTKDTSGGSVSITTTTVTLNNNLDDDGTDAQNVPEPSILLGLLGSAALIKRSRKKTIA